MLCFSSYSAMSLSWSFGLPCLLLALLLSCLPLARLFCLLLALLPAVLCSSACCWLCSSRFFSSFLPFSTLSAALRAHRRFDVLLAVLVPVSLHYLLVTTGSSAVVLSRILTTCSLTMVPSVFLSPETLCGCLHLPVCPACTSNTTQHCALRER